jgi:hypothetical protein
MEKGFSLLIYLLINSLFLLKYLARTSCPGILVLAIYLLIMLFFAVLMGWLNNKKLTGKFSLLTQWYNRNIQSKLYIPWFYIILALLTLTGIVLLHQLIEPTTIQVDRWSAIDHFLQELLAGNYPYKAQTHLGGYGSPFPAWNLFHFPFFLLGDVALALIAVMVVLIISLPRICGNYKNAFLFLLMLTISPAFWYEVAVRSDLIYNFMVCFLLCAWWFKASIRIQNAPWLTGLISGIMLSTRLSIVIPFFLFLFPGFLKAGWLQRFQFTGIALAMFMLTFLPFILWDFDSLVFFEYNPFVLQTRQGSVIELILLAGMLIPLSLSWKGKLQRFTFYTALTILVFISATFLHRMITDNFVSDLFSSRYDITYFTMALPFAIYTFTSNNN